MVTFDSMPRLAKLIKDKTDWRVVVDEYQYLLIDSGFRSDKAIALLETINEFDYVTYLSATPIADKYIQQMEHFKDVPYTELIWNNVEKIDIQRIVSNKPINNALEIVRNYQNGVYPQLDGVISKECVIFLNSVTNIVNIINQTNLKSSDVNIIVASNEDNLRIIKELGRDYEIGTIPIEGQPHKMITFCTSTAFAGCDFYSECASTFVISDNKKVHTSIDIATELVQIAGRQRLARNPFKTIVTFIYNVDVGESNSEIYKEAIKQKLEMSESMAAWKNDAPDVCKDAAIKENCGMQNLNKYSEHYVRYDEKSERFTVNHWAYLNDCFAYDVQHENYQNSFVVKKQIEKSGFDVSKPEYISDYKEQLKCILTKEGFAERMKRYCEQRRLKETQIFCLATDLMDKKYDDLRLYYDKLGYDKIKALGYKEARLKKEVELYYHANDIKRVFRATFEIGMRKTTSEIKKTMNEIYDKYGIKKTGVASNLEKLYGIRMKSIKIANKNGRREGGYEFI